MQRSFKILIEAKVSGKVDDKQLLRHAETYSGEAQQILILLTKRRIGKGHLRNLTESLRQKYPAVTFCNVTYEDICGALEELFTDYENEMQGLADDYIEYCNDAQLFDQSQYLMRIVPCGRSIDLNKRYGIYFHPSDRGYTRHRFLGVYAQKAVRYLWEIDSVFDVLLDNGKIHKTVAEGRETDEYDETLFSMIKEVAKKFVDTILKLDTGSSVEKKFVKQTTRKCHLEEFKAPDFLIFLVN